MTPTHWTTLKGNPFSSVFSLVSSTAALHVQPSLETLKVTQQLPWTLMGHWGAVLHITGLLPLQSKMFQQSAAAAIGDKGGKVLRCLSGLGRCFLPASSCCKTVSVSRASKWKINLSRSLLLATDIIQSLNHYLIECLHQQWIFCKRPCRFLSISQQ